MENNLDINDINEENKKGLRKLLIGSMVGLGIIWGALTYDLIKQNGGLYKTLEDIGNAAYVMNNAAFGASFNR